MLRNFQIFHQVYIGQARILLIKNQWSVFKRNPLRIRQLSVKSWLMGSFFVQGWPGHKRQLPCHEIRSTLLKSATEIWQTSRNSKTKMVLAVKYLFGVCVCKPLEIDRDWQLAIGWFHSIDPIFTFQDIVDRKTDANFAIIYTDGPVICKIFATHNLQR